MGNICFTAFQDTSQLNQKKDSLAVSTDNDTLPEHSLSKDITSDSLHKDDSVISDTVIPAKQEIKPGPAIPPDTKQKTTAPAPGQFNETTKPGTSIAPDTLAKNEDAQSEKEIDFVNFNLYSDSSVLLTKGPVLVEENTSSYRKSADYPVITRDIPNNEEWMLGIAVGCILLLLWLKIRFGKSLNATINAVKSYQISFRLFVSKNILYYRISIILNLLYGIVLSLFILLVLDYYNLKIFSYKGFSAWLIISSVILLILLFRYLSLKLVGFFFNSSAIFNEYIHNIFLINKNLAVFLLPFVIALIYIPYNIKNTVIIFCAIMLLAGLFLKIIRGFQIIIKKDVFIFYLILYLCTLEILPVLLGIKFLNSLG